MTVSTPTISRTFHASLLQVEWTTTIYALFFGATMLLWGKLGAIYGHRRLFIFGNLIFALGSGLVGCSWNIGMMVAMRALQGVGAAMFNPAAIALIALIFDGRERSVAYGINGMAASVGIALGYVLGGLCAEYVGWRWAFYINLPICLAAAWGVFRFVPEAKEGPRRPLDIFGVALSLLGLALAIYGLSEGQSMGWWHDKMRTGLPISPAPLALLVGIVLMVVFVARENRLGAAHREPLFDITLFKMASFRWGAIVGMLRYLGQFAVNYGVTLYLQLDEGIPALRAALISLPNALAGVIAAPLGGWLANRIGAARAVQLGLTLQAIGMLWIWHIITPKLSVWDLLGPFAIFGFGAGLASAQLNTASLQDVPREKTGDASSAITTLRQLGGSFSVAVFGLITATTVARLAQEGYDQTESGTVSMRDVVLVMLGVSLVCVVLSTRIPNRLPGGEKG
jgi:EmrB/QacA subfamily drug resistance transporter